MNDKLEENIREYFQYMESMKEFICRIELDNDGHARVLKHLACVGLLDTMSKCVPKSDSRKRFTSFIEKFCEWPECSKISLPHLVRLLQLDPSHEFNDIRKYATTKLDAWQYGSMPLLDKDLTYKEVVRLWPEDEKGKKPIEKIKPEYLSHCSLLYGLRNSIVHELRVLGNGTTALVAEEPGYHGGIKDAKNSINTWHLVYPIPFVLELVDNGIKNLKIYCQENQLDPYDYYKFGNYWIDKLN